MAVVGITHSAESVPHFFMDDKLAQLREVAELRILGSSKAEGFVGQLAEVEVLLGSWGMPQLTGELLAAAPKLQAVCYAAGTVKGFVTPQSWARGVQVTTAMHANAIPVAEVSVALIVLANKQWFACQDRARRAGKDGLAASYKDGHLGNYGATIGLIGFGAIGREVLVRLRSFHYQVLVADPYADAQAVAAAGASLVTLDELAQASDVVSLHAPNIPATKHMINAAFLQRMKTGATFINTARGALVDEDALVAELQSGRISAMLDVTCPEPPEAGHPFYTLENCWLTPHRAGSSGNEVRRMGSYAIDDCLRILRGEAPRYPVTEAMLATMA